MTKLAPALLSAIMLAQVALPASAEGRVRGFTTQPLYKSYVWVRPTPVAPRERSRAATIERHRYVASLRRGRSGEGWSCHLSGAGALASCALH